MPVILLNTEIWLCQLYRLSIHYRVGSTENITVYIGKGLCYFFSTRTMSHVLAPSSQR